MGRGTEGQLMCRETEGQQPCEKNCCINEFMRPTAKAAI